MKTIAIIVAGGSGTRFGGSVPKQFAMLDGEPVLMRAIEAIDNAFAGESHMIMVALSESLWPQWIDFIRKYEFKVAHDVIDGGATRFGSVFKVLRNLRDVDDDDVVLVHDAARPLVPAHVVRNVAEAVRRWSKRGVVPAVPLTDSVRRVGDNGSSEAVDRATLRAVQTPQGFNARSLMKAYDLASLMDQATFTDDASVFEAVGGTIKMVDGDPSNIKITYPADLLVAEQILKERRDG